MILDGAHNPAAAKALKKTLVNSSYRNFPSTLLSPGGRGKGEGVIYENLILILGILNDKDISGIVKELVPLAKEVIVTKPRTERAVEPEDLARVVRKYTTNVTVRRATESALSYALKQASAEDTILLTGSLYLVGEARKHLDRFEGRR